MITTIEPFEYRYKGQGYAASAAAVVGLAMMLFYWKLIVVESDILARPTTLLWCFFAGGSLFVLGGIGMLITSSPIFIDDVSISRKLLGFTLKSIAWENIECIRVRRYMRPGKKPSRYFWIIPKVVRGFRVYPSGRMNIIDGESNMKEFVARINLEIAKHNIPVHLNDLGQLCNPTIIPD